MFLRLFMTVLFFGMTCQANAESIWSDDLTIKSAAYFWNGSQDVIEVTWNESITTGCATTDSQNIASMKREGIINFTKLLYTTILTAQASNKKISLLLNTDTCGAESGVSFSGVKIVD